jgi:hypothetical protein
MWHRIIGSAMIVLLLILACTTIAVAQPSEGSKPQQSGGSMKSMDEMMKECPKHQQEMMNSMEQMGRMMREAKQSDNPAKMRAALDEAQKPLMDMKERMTMCMNMMNMMEKMRGGMGAQMGGMMQGGSGGEMQGMMSEKQDQKTGQKTGSMTGGRGMGEKDATCPMCIVEMILLGLLIFAAIAALIALTIFLMRRSRRPA